MSEPHTPAVIVRRVTGRYPSRPRALRSENVEVLVAEREPGVFILRIDDRGHDDFWMELVAAIGGRGRESPAAGGSADRRPDGDRPSTSRTSPV